MLDTINIYFEELDRELGPAAQAAAIGAGFVASTVPMAGLIDFGDSSIIRSNQNGNIQTEVINAPANIDTLTAIESLTGTAAIFLGATLLTASGIKRLKQNSQNKTP